MVGLPKLRSIGEPGMSAANVSGSVATRIAASHVVASHISTAGTHATGTSDRRRAKIGYGSSSSSATVIRSANELKRRSPRSGGRVDLLVAHLTDPRVDVGSARLDDQ